MDQEQLLNMARIKEAFGEQHAEVYRRIASEDRVMSTYALECACDMDKDILDLCLGDLVRANFIRVFQKHGRRSAWETVKDVAKAS